MKKRVILLGFSILCVTCVGTIVRFVSAQQTTNESLTKLSKTAEVGGNWNNSITLNLSGIRETDAVNIAVGNSGIISAKVVTVANRTVTFPGGNRSITIPLPGTSVPTDSLTISSSEISFNRPEINGQVLLYIEIPESVKVTISQNNSLVAEKYLVTSPLKVKNGALTKGQPTLSKSVIALMHPEAETDKDEIKQVGDGVYFVPFEKLEILSGQNTYSGLAFTANVDIDETGVVRTVKVLHPLNSTQVQNALMSLRFAPFKLNGNNVKVSTVIRQ